MNDQFVIGLDFGTDSVRALVCRVSDGQETASAVAAYPRWRDQLYCDPTTNLFRQHPLDYLESMETAVREALRQAGDAVRRSVKAIAVDTTGSTPVATDASGTPLALLPQFAENPHAMFVLWKDHTATAEAAEINEHATRYPTNYLQFVGGIYSSEWFWAKLLHTLRVDQDVRKAAYSWVEHCDWIPFVLTGGNKVSEMKRGVCSAGHKALWAEEFGGLPPDRFFAELDPLLAGFTSRLFSKVYTSDQSAGRLSKTWAEKFGLSEDIVVAVGAFDAHMGAVGSQIEEYHLSKVMGTSTCDMLVAPRNEMKGKLVRGICGQVDSSIIPGKIGLEAGQSAFGDTYAWFRKVLMWPLENLGTTSVDNATMQRLREEWSASMIAELSRQAAALPLNPGAELSLDWLNGRRTPDANQELKAGIVGLNLGSSAVTIFRSLAESTCFGARAIVERFREEGVPVRGLIGLGGVARKSPYIMQMMADVMNMPLRIHRSDQTCAAGAAMFAATAAGLYRNVEEAMQCMGQGFSATYQPDKARAEYYQRRFSQFGKLGASVESLRQLSPSFL